MRTRIPRAFSRDVLFIAQNHIDRDAGVQTAIAAFDQIDVPGRRRFQRPPPPPPPPPPPEEPPPPPPEELPGTLEEEAICELRLLPTALVKLPRSPMLLPWYQEIPAVAAATAAAPAATVNFFVHASSTSRATAYGSSIS